MKYALKKGTEIVFKDAPLRAPKPDEVRVKVAACGVCGTDLHQRPGEPKEEKVGHEIAGTILELGPAVSGLAVGQRVVLESSSACGRCANCRNAAQELCTNVQSFFGGGALGMAEEMLAPALSAIPYDGLDPAVACLQEPLGVAIDLVRVADVRPGANVLVVGPGAIGLMAVALVKRAGARRVFVAGHKRRTARVEVARRFGADTFVDVDEADLTKYAFGCPVDRVLVTAPPRTLASAFKVASKGGIVAFVGIEHGEGAFSTFDANAFHFKKLQLRASFAAPALFGPLALEYLRDGVVDGAALVTHRFPLDRAAEAFRVANDDPAAIKVVVTP